MKVLIVGGTGMIGSNLAHWLAAQGVAVTLGARHAAAPGTAMARFPLLQADYTQGGFSAAELAGFDAVVFGAGNDIRHIGPDDDAQAFWRNTQTVGVPAFVARARAAGVPRLVQLGSYYHQVLPHLIDRNSYVQARAVADREARALATRDFNVCTINPPSIVGVPPGLATPRYAKLVAYARGQLDIPYFAPLGGTNYMSVRSLCEAVWGALQRAQSGQAYLVGDENLSFRDFFQLFFDAVGNPHQLEARDQEHPLLPAAYIVPGRNSVLAYEPDAAEVKLLAYGRHDMRRAVAEVLRVY